MAHSKLKELWIYPKTAWDFVRYVYTSVLFSIVFIAPFVMSLIFLGLLMVFAQHQLLLLQNTQQFAVSGSDLFANANNQMSLFSNCVSGFKAIWNTNIHFFFSVFQIVLAAKGINSFNNLRSIPADQVPAETYHDFVAVHLRMESLMFEIDEDERNTAVDFMCDIFKPLGEQLENLLKLLLGFASDFIASFLCYFTGSPACSGPLNSFNILLNMFAGPFLNKVDPKGCIHPVFGPHGFPGNVLKSACAGCSASDTDMNASFLTRMNAVPVCVCGGSLTDSPINVFLGCIHFSSVVDFFNGVASFFTDLFQKVSDLVTSGQAVNTIVNGFETAINGIKDTYSKVRSKVCDIPFMCKILKIRSIQVRTASGVLIAKDDPYICSIDTRTGETMVCFYESEWNIPQFANLTDSMNTMTNAMNRVKNIGSPLVIAQPPVAGYENDNNSAPVAERSFRSMEDAEVYGEDGAITFADMLIVYLRGIQHALSHRESPGISYFLREMHRRDVRPWEIKTGLRRAVNKINMRPAEYEVCGLKKNEPMERATPQILNLFILVTSISATFSLSSGGNFGSIIVGVAFFLLAMGLTLIPVVWQMGTGLLANVFPLPGSYVPYEPFSGLVNLFSGFFNRGFSEIVPIPDLTSLFTNVSNFLDGALSRIGLMLVQQIFNFDILLLFGQGMGVPHNPNIGSINDFLNSIATCNSERGCRVPDDCNFFPCDCQNGTIVENIGHCGWTGTCQCFLTIASNAAATTTNSISITTGIDPTEFGYISESVSYPRVSLWQTILNCMEVFWNGGLPFICTVFEFGINVPFVGALLTYVFRLCKCCAPLSNFMWKVCTYMMPISLVTTMVLQTTRDQCFYSSRFYCMWFKHFFRTKPVTFIDLWLFFLNISPNGFGAIFWGVLFIFSGLLFYILFPDFFKMGIHGYRTIKYKIESDDEQVEF